MNEYLSVECGAILHSIMFTGDQRETIRNNALLRGELQNSHSNNFRSGHNNAKV